MDKTKLWPNQTQKRKILLQRESLDEKSATVRAALSSEEPVERMFGTEILVHSEDAIDMSRAKEGLPLLDEHERLIGRINDIALESDGKTRGTLKFSQNTERGREVLADVRDDFLRDISVGYRILDWKEGDGDEVRVTRWMPLEASVVAVPADATVGINRKLEATKMPDEKTGGSEVASDEINVSQIKQVRQRNLKEGKKAGQTEERQRQAGIRQRFDAYLSRGQEYRDLMDNCLERNVSVTRAMELLLELNADQEPIFTAYEQREDTMQDVASPIRRADSGSRPTEVRVKADEYERFVEGVGVTLDVRAGLADDEAKKENASSEFRGLTLAEMARMFCEKRHVSLSGLSRDQMVGRSFTLERAIQMRAGMINATGSDFANLLSNVANKALQVGYEEAEETWSMWCSTGSTSDFKIFERPNLSGFSDLDEVGESAEYTYGKFIDEKESAKVVTYGKLFSISRQAIINDDLSALTSAPRAMGRAAARKVGDKVYEILTANPNMADGNPLFDASHNNENTTPTAPSVKSIDDIRVAMQLQTDPNNITVGIMPAYLLCPLQLLGTCLVLSRDQYDPEATAGTLTSNIVQNTFTPIGERRLSQDSAADWYMAAAPNSFSTIEVTFLDGVQTPFLDEQDGWNVDGAEYKVRLDCVAKALNWRGMYKQTGV